MTGLNMCCELPFLVVVGLCLVAACLAFVVGITNDDRSDGVEQLGTSLVLFAFGTVMGGAWIALRFVVH